MRPMVYFLALIPATGLTIGGYFVLFLSNRSEGNFRAFGKHLAFWCFTLAGLVILGSIFAAAAGGRGRDRNEVREFRMMRGMEGPMGPGQMGPGFMAMPPGAYPATPVPPPPGAPGGPQPGVLIPPGIQSAPTPPQ